MIAGANGYGMSGLSDTAHHPSRHGDNEGEMGDKLPAVLLGLGLTATAITCGVFHTCALLSNG